MKMHADQRPEPGAAPRAHALRPVAIAAATAALLGTLAACGGSSDTDVPARDVGTAADVTPDAAGHGEKAQAIPRKVYSPEQIAAAGKAAWARSGKSFTDSGPWAPAPTAGSGKGAAGSPQLAPTASLWNYCAPEWGICVTANGSSETREVRYGRGSNMSSYYRTIRGGSTPCTNDVFGDPTPGYVKRCDVGDPGPSGILAAVGWMGLDGSPGDWVGGVYRTDLRLESITVTGEYTDQPTEPRYRPVVTRTFDTSRDTVVWGSWPMSYWDSIASPDKWHEARNYWYGYAGMGNAPDTVTVTARLRLGSQVQNATCYPAVMPFHPSNQTRDWYRNLPASDNQSQWRSPWTCFWEKNGTPPPLYARQLRITANPDRWTTFQQVEVSGSWSSTSQGAQQGTFWSDLGSGRTAIVPPGYYQGQVNVRARLAQGNNYRMVDCGTQNLPTVPANQTQAVEFRCNW